MNLKPIALVDDSSPFCLLVKQIFEDRYEVDTYATATDFLTMMSRVSRYALIILDINMPGMDGLEALEKLKKSPATRSIPTLLLTADARKDTVIRGMKLGAQDYMVKPIDPAALEERVAVLLGETLLRVED
ncbi:response regulator [Paenibacillus filicis]|uniref:Response regulator n=1 Tax=Paenibacillus gyeongsangnamensis TaxID=3388067 RepID=A0ABT4QLE6_9BACL|nr:response regulator [Paenibacillus filicis]MCZ8517696.1 response regulator [Paenibacillus filicis]